MRFFWVLLLVAACWNVVAAQGAEGPVHAPDADTFEIINNILIPAVPHAPFSCVVRAEWTRTLEDGSTITRQNHRVVMRDGAGRIFQERRTLVPKDGTAEPELTRVELSDPNKHIKYFCHPQSHTCMMREYTSPAAEDTEPTGFTDEGKMVLTRDDLGKSSISGVEVVGTRETRVIGAGVIGNDRPVSIVKEFWYSPQLGLNVTVKRSDPRHGTQTFTVTELSLAEPEVDHFKVPAGYKIVDARASAEKNRVSQVPGQSN